MIESEALLAGLMSKVGFAVFRRTEDGRFPFVCPPPPWWVDVWKGGDKEPTTETLSDQFPFLSDFLVESASTWRAASSGLFRSGIWEESGASGKSYGIEAIATRSASENILILEILGVHGDDMQQILQTGRENALSFARSLQERQKAEEALKKAREQADLSSRAKSEFIANVSHEIRTPMNGILGLTELLLETEENPERQDSLSMVKESADSLLEIINDLLDFSKIEAGKMSFADESFDLVAEIERVFRSFRLRSDRKGIDLKLDVDDDVPPTLVGDPGRLRQVLVNLLGNALKFTEQGHVALRVGTVTEKRGKLWLQFSVEDTGVGIPEDQLGQIFEAFSQADGTVTRRFEGTGLGLAISSALVKMMRGRIWVDSRVGEGSTFHFTACLGIPDGPASVDDGAPDLHGVRTLIVATDQSADRIEADLRRWGLEPAVAFDAHTAFLEMGLSNQAGEPFQLTIVEAGLPGAAELIRDIDDNEHLAAAHLILVGGDDNSPLARDARARGCRVADSEGEGLQEVLVETLNAPAIVAEKEGSVSGHFLNILLAEDNAVNRRLAQALLEKKGHRVEMAADGLEAVDAVKRQAFDLILMDVNMPGMDGFEATAKIRELEAGTGKSTPIVAMTAHAMAGDRERCLKAGMDDYTSKPIQVDDLMRVLSEVAPASVPEEADSEGPLIDPEELMARVEGDVELLATMIELFEEDLDDVMHGIRQAILMEDAESLEHNAHKLRGAVGNFGEGRVYQALNRLERMGEAANVSQANDVLGQLENLIPRMMVEVRALAGQG